VPSAVEWSERYDATGSMTPGKTDETWVKTNKAPAAGLGPKGDCVRGFALQVTGGH
jgi:hypothetical protein